MYNLNNPHDKKMFEKRQKEGLENERHSHNPKFIIRESR